MIADNVVYLTIADKSYPRKLAFSYLDELSKEFQNSYGAKVDSARKPYAFVGFGARHFCHFFRARLTNFAELNFICVCVLCVVFEFGISGRYVHEQDGAVVPGYEDCKCSELEYQQVERRAAGRNAYYDQEHGRASLAWGLVRQYVSISPSSISFFLPLPPCD